MPPAKAKPKGEPPKKPPRQNRPRVDAVIRHIESGSYDSEIGKLLSAIETRREARQKAVLDQVKQVYGEDFTVAPALAPVVSSPAPLRSAQRPNPFVDPPAAVAPAPEEWQEAERRARAQEEALKTEDFGDDDVSNSPLIGSIEVPEPAPAPQKTDTDDAPTP
jgi:hypothetical protein